MTDSILADLNFKILSKMHNSWFVRVSGMTDHDDSDITVNLKCLY